MVLSNAVSIQRALILVWLVNSGASVSNNVCRSFEDFAHMADGQCWHNPDIDATPEQVARNHGLELKRHFIKTKDNYHVTLFRIGEERIQGVRPPVLLHHGLMTNALTFMFVGNRSMAFSLARKGYDVWLANHRGTTYSTGHSNLRMTDRKYWDFSFHEIALYDIPEIVEYVSLNANNSKIVYVGHSMGTTISFIYSSLRKNHAERFLKGIVALAPVASMKNSPILFRSLMPTLNQLLVKIQLLGVNVLFPDPKALNRLIVAYCSQYPQIKTCFKFHEFFNGKDNGEFVTEDFLAVLSHYPSRTSIKCLHHYAQHIVSGRFQHYDYGVAENLRRYKSAMPPLYPIGDISVPVHLFYALSDNLVSPQDVAWLFQNLRTAEKSIEVLPKGGEVKYNHVDFVSGRNAEKFVNEPVVKVVEKLHAGS